MSSTARVPPVVISVEIHVTTPSNITHEREVRILVGLDRPVTRSAIKLIVTGNRRSFSRFLSPSLDQVGAIPRGVRCPLRQTILPLTRFQIADTLVIRPHRTLWG